MDLLSALEGEPPDRRELGRGERRLRGLVWVDRDGDAFDFGFLPISNLDEFAENSGVACLAQNDHA